MRGLYVCLILIIWSMPNQAAGDVFYDAALRRIITDFNVRPLPTKPFEETEKYKLGRALFFDPILSGNRDVACATCHIVQYGSSDGLAASIGTGARGIGPERKQPVGRLRQPRNSLDLWNRDNDRARSMFWDGRVEVLDPARRVFRSPMGTLLPKGFDNVMAVQAIFPLARADEMLGVEGDTSPSHLPSRHANRINEIAGRTSALEGPERIEGVAALVVARLIGTGGKATEPWQSTYQDLFKAAYPEEPANDISIVHVGNALSHFEEIAFASRNTPWDRYVDGDTNAISIEAKQGAFVFFGKGRCAVCHEGPLFSDFDFHAIGVPDASSPEKWDQGRFLATGAARDKFKFRTPPLRNVTLTAPYFHNGRTATLEDAITQHVNPLRHADRYQDSGAFAMNLDQIEAISPILSVGLHLSADDVAHLIAFLTSLEDDKALAEEGIIPVSVPSGLPVGGFE